jgi:antitoxin VapB
MKSAKLFKNGDSQAVRLPKEFRFKGTEVWIRRVGSSVVLTPKGATWDDLLAARAKFTADFMSERQQPAAAEERDWPWP